MAVLSHGVSAEKIVFADHYIENRAETDLPATSLDRVDSTELLGYCQKAKSVHEKIPLMGFKTALRVPIRIEDLYVPLRAMIDERLTGKATFADAEEAEASLQACQGGRDISVPDAFKAAHQHNRRGLVMLGDPGSGKTTHLKRVLLWCLQGGLGDLGLPHEMIPVFLPLRDLTDVTRNLDDFIQQQLNQPHLGTPQGFGKRLIARGNLLFLLDGLDEVADATHRSQVARWIEKALTVYPTCWFVITCRFAGYTDDARLGADFLEMHLRPLTTDQAETFIRNWYRIVQTTHTSDREQATILADQRADELIERLRQPDFRARRVFELTRNPLLLTNICLVHLSRGNLPHTRAALYDECTDVLLERWRGAKGVHTRITAQLGRRVLQPVAYWLHQQHARTRATVAELTPVIAPVLQAIGWGPHDQGKAPQLPATVQRHCIDFFISLPGLDHRDALLALLNHAVLDRELHTQISVDRPSAQFFHTLIATLFQYGTLRDGRNALTAVVETALNYGGQEQRAAGQRLIQEIDDLVSEYNRPATAAQEFLQTVRDESGLLTGWDQEHYGFMHLGFQEYLTASEIRNKAFKDPAVLRGLAANFGEDWWQEVILLLLALDNPSAFEPFMGAVLNRPGVAAYRTLFELCLDDAAEPSPQPFLGVLAVDAGQDEDLWQRQFLAVQVVARLAPEALEPLTPKLRQHPSPQIQHWLQEQIKQTRQTVITAEPGGYELVFIPGRVFQMGSPETEEGRYPDEVLHEVQLSDFYLGRYPVTNAEYGRFLAANSHLKEPDYWSDRNFNQPNQPVVGVRWEDAQAYAAWAGLSLPTEAQWEYACRAGTTTRYYTGDTEADLDRAGWYSKNSGKKLHPVGEKAPNAFGLYDMHGNVFEWCQDRCDVKDNTIVTDTYRDGVVDPVSKSGSDRVNRGGSWYGDARGCRSAFRSSGSPGDRYYDLGFRLVRTPA